MSWLRPSVHMLTFDVCSALAQCRQPPHHWEESYLVTFAFQRSDHRLTSISSYIIPDAVVSGLHCKLYAYVSSHLISRCY